MWIKHNDSLYNSDHIVKIVVARTKLKAMLKDGSEILLGEFRATKECQDIFNSVSRALLFDNPDNPGIIIKDTKDKREREND